jgi:hypothetical protein
MANRYRVGTDDSDTQTTKYYVFIGDVNNVVVADDGDPATFWCFQNYVSLPIRDRLASLAFGRQIPASNDRDLRRGCGEQIQCLLTGLCRHVVSVTRTVICSALHNITRFSCTVLMLNSVTAWCVSTTFMIAQSNWNRP